MPSFPRALARLAKWRGWLPLAIPLAMFAALLALGGDRGYFYRYGSYNTEASHKTLTVAENLSPRHNFLFLYGNTDPLDLCRSERRLFETSESSARSTFDVHLKTDHPPALRYYKSDCSPQDYEAPFFVHFCPNDLAGESERIGFEGVSPVTKFTRRAAFDGACVITLHLWDEDGYFRAALIRTGQYISGGERLWEVSITPPVSAERVAATKKLTAPQRPASRRRAPYSTCIWTAAH